MGLKLKGPPAPTEPNPQGSSQSANSKRVPSENNVKRKLDATPALSRKRARYDPVIARSSFSTPARQKRKSVTFTEDAKLETGTPSAKWTPATAQRQNSSLEAGKDSSPALIRKSRPKNKKKTKRGTKKLKPSPAPNLDVALNYLRTWKSNRNKWKFNKNHQTNLLRHMFSPPDPACTSKTTIPAADVPALIDYIRNIKGFVRTRLRQAAQDVKDADMAPYSHTYTGFPEGTHDVGARQTEYDDLARKLLNQPKSPNVKNPPVSFDFSEPEFHRTHSGTSTLVARRFVRRMRAEMVLDSIGSESDSSVALSPDGCATESTTDVQDHGRGYADKRVKLENGKRHKVKRKRKLRTAEIASDSNSDDSSSNGSESDGKIEDSSDKDENHGEASGSSTEDSEEDASPSDEEEAEENLVTRRPVVPPAASDCDEVDVEEEGTKSSTN